MESDTPVEFVMDPPIKEEHMEEDSTMQEQPEEEQQPEEEEKTNEPST